MHADINFDQFRQTCQSAPRDSVPFDLCAKDAFVPIELDNVALSYTRHWPESHDVCLWQQLAFCTDSALSTLLACTAFGMDEASRHGVFVCASLGINCINCDDDIRCCSSVSCCLENLATVSIVGRIWSQVPPSCTPSVHWLRPGCADMCHHYGGLGVALSAWFMGERVR